MVFGKTVSIPEWMHVFTGDDGMLAAKICCEPLPGTVRNSNFFNITLFGLDLRKEYNIKNIFNLLFFILKFLKTYHFNLKSHCWMPDRLLGNY